MLTLGREGKENSVKLKCVIRSSAQGRAHKTTKLDAEMYVFGYVVVSGRATEKQL